MVSNFVVRRVLSRTLRSVLNSSCEGLPRYKSYKPRQTDDLNICRVGTIAQERYQLAPRPDTHVDSCGHRSSSVTEPMARQYRQMQLVNLYNWFPAWA